MCWASSTIPVKWHRRPRQNWKPSGKLSARRRSKPARQPRKSRRKRTAKAAEAAKAGKKRNAPVEVEEETLIDLVENDEVDEKALSQKEINRMKLAAGPPP